MKTAWRTVAAVAAGWALTPVAMAAINVSTFAADDEGWESIDTDTQVASGGAVDNGGYLRINRSNADPIGHAVSSTDGGMFVGNLQTTYGEGGATDGLTISLYYRDFSTGTAQANPRYLAMMFSSGANDNFLINPGTYPVNPPAVVKAEWRQMSLEIKFDWSDAQASAAGWNHNGSGSMTWAQVMENVTRFRVQSWDDLTGNGLNQALGIDEFTFASVPEPAGLTVLGLGASVALRRRRR